MEEMSLTDDVEDTREFFQNKKQDEPTSSSTTPSTFWKDIGKLGINRIKKKFVFQMK